MITLKEKYARKQAVATLDRVRRADKKIVSEGTLNEAYDDKAKIALDLVKKLQATNFGNIDLLNTAKDRAIEDMQKAIAGGGKDPIRAVANLFKKITGKGTQQENNPLSTTLAFIKGMDHFFETFMQTVETFHGRNGDITLRQAMTGGPGKPGQHPESRKLEQQKKVKDFLAMIVKGLRTEDPMSKLGSDWTKKYLNFTLDVGDTGLKKLAEQLLDTKISNLRATAKSVAENFKNIDNLVQAPSGTGSGGTSPSQEQTTSSGPSGNEQPKTSSPGESSKASEASGGTEPGGENINKRQAAFDKIKKTFSSSKGKKFDMQKFVKKLVAAGFDPDKFTV